uniref:Uncharacterized protein n=1 Tax=Globodera pallida TaxID=36090 RepID=A0A183BMC6_GLOPA
MSTIPVDEILGGDKENVEISIASAKGVRPRGPVKPKGQPVTLTELQYEVSKARDEVVAAVKTEIGEVLGKFSTELEDVKIATLRMAKVMDEMAGVLEEKKVRAEFEEMSLEDEGQEEENAQELEVEAEAAPEEVKMGLENSHANLPNQSPVVLPRGGRGHFGHRGGMRASRGHGGRGGYSRGGAPGYSHAHHHYHMRKHSQWQHHQGTAGSSHCECRECGGTRRFGIRRFRPYGQGPR